MKQTCRAALECRFCPQYNGLRGGCSSWQRLRSRLCRLPASAVTSPVPRRGRDARLPATAAETGDGRRCPVDGYPAYGGSSQFMAVRRSRASENLTLSRFYFNLRRATQGRLQSAAGDSRTQLSPHNTGRPGRLLHHFTRHNKVRNVPPENHDHRTVGRI